MRKAIAIAAAFILTVLAVSQFVTPAAAQDDRLDARPGDFVGEDGAVDIVSYLGASSALLSASGVAPGQEVSITIDGFEDGDTVTVWIANPATVLGTFVVGSGGSLMVTIPEGFREGYAEIIASTSSDIASLGDASTAQVYVTDSGTEIVTEELVLSTDTDQLITLTELAVTGRETLVLLGMATMLIMSGFIFLEATRSRRSTANALR